MDSRWRNLLILIVVIAAAVGIYLNLPSQEPGFEQEYAELQGAWKSEGLNQETLHADFDALMALPENKLNEIKSNLQASIANLENEASKEIAEAYILLINIAINTKEIQTLNESIDSSVDICNNIPVFQSINSKQADLINLAESFDLTVDSFTEEFPEEAAEISFNRIGLIAEEMRAQLNEDNETLALLELEC